MYSLILLAGMTAAADAPQGLLANRSGCNGTATAMQAVRVRVSTAVQTHPVRSTLASINDARPHVLGHAVAVHQANVAHRAAARSTGCVGSCGVSVQVQAGNGFAPMPSTATRTVVTVAPVAPAAPQLVGGPFRDHRVIKAFLARHGAPEAKLNAMEAKYGAGSNVWLDALMAFVRAGLKGLMDYLASLGI